MFQIGRRATARRLFENFKNSQKSQNSNFKILVHHFFSSMSPVYCKKFDSIRTKLTEEIHFEVCPYGDSGNIIAAAARRSPGYCNLLWLDSSTHFQIPPFLFSSVMCVCLFGHLRVRLCLCVRAALLVARCAASTRLFRAQPVCAGAKDNERLLICRLTCATCEVDCKHCRNARIFSQFYVSRD